MTMIARLLRGSSSTLFFRALALLNITLSLVLAMASPADMNRDFEMLRAHLMAVLRAHETTADRVSSPRSAWTGEAAGESEGPTILPKKVLGLMDMIDKHLTSPTAEL